MTTENHSKGSDKFHETLSQDRLAKRLAEIEVHIEMLEELLLRGKEDQRYGWIFPKKVKWHMLQVKLKNRFNAKLREAFRIVEYEDKGCICEPEQGKILGEDEDEGEGIDEIRESRIFSDNLFMNARFTGTKNKEQLLKTVMQVKRYGDMFSKNIKEEHGQSLVTGRSEMLFQYKVVEAVTERQM